MEEVEAAIAKEQACQRKGILLVSLILHQDDRRQIVGAATVKDVMDRLKAKVDLKAKLEASLVLGDMCCLALHNFMSGEVMVQRLWDKLAVLEVANCSLPEAVS